MKRCIHGLYGIVDDAHCDDLVGAGQAMLDSGCTVIQLRCKKTTITETKSAAGALQVACVRVGALLLVNDIVEIAAELDGVGVHIGQKDAHPRLVRSVVGPDRVIGVSTHDPEELADAHTWGADYVGFGPVFSTSTKDQPMEGQGLDALAAAVASSRIPVVAIGGITLETIGAVAGTGADAAAVIGDLYRGPSIVERGRALGAAFELGRQSGSSTRH